MRTIVRFQPGRFPSHSWVYLRTIVSFLRTGRSRQPDPEQLWRSFRGWPGSEVRQSRTIVRSGRNSESRHRTIWRWPGLCCCPKYRTIQARPARKPDTPETRGWTPDPTLQVNSLFSGFYINLLYRNWLVMGFVRYFHAFMGNVLKFLKFWQNFFSCHAICTLM